MRIYIVILGLFSILCIFSFSTNAKEEKDCNFCLQYGDGRWHDGDMGETMGEAFGGEDGEGGEGGMISEGWMQGGGGYGDQNPPPKPDWCN